MLCGWLRMSRRLCCGRRRVFQKMSKKHSFSAGGCRLQGRVDALEDRCKEFQRLQPAALPQAPCFDGGGLGGRCHCCQTPMSSLIRIQAFVEGLLSCSMGPSRLLFHRKRAVRDRFCGWSDIAGCNSCLS